MNRNGQIDWSEADRKDKGEARMMMRILLLAMTVTSCAVVAEESSSTACVDRVGREAVRDAVLRAMEFEHARDRVEAIEAMRIKARMDREQMADVLLGVATNGNNRFAMRDFARYATTNQLAAVEGIVEDAGRPAAFRVAAFRALSDIDGFGERTLRIVGEIGEGKIAFAPHDREKMLSHIRLSLPKNDVRRAAFSMKLEPVKGQEGRK